MPPHTPPPPPPKPLDPFRRAVLRGLGVLMPPLLTIVIFLWVGNTVMRYVLRPLEDATRAVLVDRVFTIRDADDFAELPAAGADAVSDAGETFYRAPDGRFVSQRVFTGVENNLRKSDPAPESAREYVIRYVDHELLRPWIVVPTFLSVFLLLLYALGKFLAAGIGRFFWGQFESLITRLPVISNVYSSVKQVTDFLFTDPDLEINRVVAVEYPRKGVWTVAFVTGESMLDIESAANEAVMSVLIPTSPMPFTGFTITVKKSESVDLNITIDQAFQFIVSCGVVVPPQQIRELAAGEGADKPDTSAYGLAQGEPPLKGAMHPNGATGAALLDRPQAPESTGDDG